mgnify:FL=1
MQIQQPWGFKLDDKKNKVDDLDLRVKKNFFPQQLLSESGVGANASRIKDGHKSRNVFYSVGGSDFNSNVEYFYSCLKSDLEKALNK